MRDELSAALDSAIFAGAEYADVRRIEASWESVYARAFVVENVDRGARLGVGLRARMNGAWGFAAGTDLSNEGLRDLAILATENARIAALLSNEESQLAPIAPVEASWTAPVTRDPFAASVAERAELIFDAERGARAMPAVRYVAGQISATREVKTFASTEGSYLLQDRVVTGVGCRAVAESADGLASRSFPQGGRGQFGLGGLELITNMNLRDWGERAAEEATMLITAPPCPTGPRALILSGSQLAAVIHETVGHVAELDSGLLPIADLGRFELGSEVVNLTADSLQATGLGTYAFDDEGAPAARWNLVENGVWLGGFASRELAAATGVDAGWGSMRAEGFHRSPRIRMNNVSLMPLNHTLDELIADTELGLLIDTLVRTIVDRQRGWFRCEAEIGWEIENGRIRQIVGRPIFESDMRAFWQACDAICDEHHYGLWSITDCRRGGPAQSVATSHGAAPARFRGIRVIADDAGAGR